MNQCSCSACQKIVGQKDLIEQKLCQENVPLEQKIVGQKDLIEQKPCEIKVPIQAVKEKNCVFETVVFSNMNVYTFTLNELILYSKLYNLPSVAVHISAQHAAELKMWGFNLKHF